MDSVTWVGMFLVVCPGITDLWAVGASALCGGIARIKINSPFDTTSDRRITNEKLLENREQFYEKNLGFIKICKLSFLLVQVISKTDGVHINQRIDQIRARYQEGSARNFLSEENVLQSVKIALRCFI